MNLTDIGVINHIADITAIYPGPFHPFSTVEVQSVGDSS